MGFTWKRAAALERQEWRRGVALCIYVKLDKSSSGQMASSGSRQANQKGKERFTNNCRKRN